MTPHPPLAFSDLESDQLGETFAIWRHSCFATRRLLKPADWWDVSYFVRHQFPACFLAILFPPTVSCVFPGNAPWFHFWFSSRLRCCGSASGLVIYSLSSSPPLSLPFHSSLFTNICYFSWWVQTQLEFSSTFTKHLGLVRFSLLFVFLINTSIGTLKQDGLTSNQFELVFMWKVLAIWRFNSDMHTF